MTSDDRVLRVLLDKQEIREQMARYCHAIDSLDLDLLRQVYHADALHVHHSNYDGPASSYVTHIIDYCREQYKGTTHMIDNELIEVEGDTATSRTYYQSWCRMQRDGAEFDRFAAGRYLDRWERREGGWRIAQRRVLLDRTRIDQVAETQPATPADTKR